MTHEIPASHVRLKRVYEPAAPDDGVRVLVDRLWPRGLRKADAAIGRWMKDIAPSGDALPFLAARAGPVAWLRPRGGVIRLALITSALLPSLRITLASGQRRSTASPSAVS